MDRLPVAWPILILGFDERSPARDGGGSGVRLPFADSPEFRRLIDRAPGPEPDLVRIGLEIAGDAYPGLDPEPYLARVEALVTRARERGSGGSPREVLGRINWVLFVEEGFRGNTDDYYDPRNSYLNEVLDRKTGIPITLSVLYWRLAERLGLSVAGVNLPAHFMLRVGRGDATVFVDPFHAGALLDRAGCERQIARVLGREIPLDDHQFAPCSRSVVVSRMLRNLKAIYLQNDDYVAAVPVQRRLAALNADEPQEQRDLGMLCLQVDRPAEAIAPLQAYLDSSPEGPEADRVRAVLRAARREVARWN
jgi:regulator of sirC expression with transglutaminase-like and TPR domain